MPKSSVSEMRAKQLAHIERLGNLEGLCPMLPKDCRIHGVEHESHLSVSDWTYEQATIFRHTIWPSVHQVRLTLKKSELQIMETLLDLTVRCKGGEPISKGDIPLCPVRGRSNGQQTLIDQLLAYVASCGEETNDPAACWEHPERWTAPQASHFYEAVWPRCTDLNHGEMSPVQVLFVDKLLAAAVRRLTTRQTPSAAAPQLTRKQEKHAMFFNRHKDLAGLCPYMMCCTSKKHWPDVSHIQPAQWSPEQAVAFRERIWPVFKTNRHGMTPPQTTFVSSLLDMLTDQIPPTRRVSFFPPLDDFVRAPERWTAEHERAFWNAWVDAPIRVGMTKSQDTFVDSLLTAVLGHLLSVSAPHHVAAKGPAAKPSLIPTSATRVSTSPPRNCVPFVRWYEDLGGLCGYMLNCSVKHHTPALAHVMPDRWTESQAVTFRDRIWPRFLQNRKGMTDRQVTFVTSLLEVVTRSYALSAPTSCSENASQASSKLDEVSQSAESSSDEGSQSAESSSDANGETEPDAESSSPDESDPDDAADSATQVPALTADAPCAEDALSASRDASLRAQAVLLDHARFEALEKQIFALHQRFDQLERVPSFASLPTLPSTPDTAPAAGVDIEFLVEIQARHEQVCEENRELRQTVAELRTKLREENEAKRQLQQELSHFYSKESIQFVGVGDPSESVP